ncbi:Subtilase family protein [Franzmannia pantelleriensis]|uniref:Subtilase family protein n=1 Tax=Franzmannia pantelleriensis TaxID=48727 RepID=A0A1G9R6I3_9GAMM|nr:S8 family peptidase [Halomonas pantelleriensis]SDM18896.1 Subtilase family protein [Halomonas pantelleriensis]
MDYEHLFIERELLKNERRTRRMNIPRPDRGDLRDHGQRLLTSLNHSIEYARRQPSSRPGNFVFKIRYTGPLDINHLQKHGVQFVSQEDGELCVVFADEAGLAIFSDHLQKLGIDEEELTYKQILEAIEGVENWTAEDRKSWVVNKEGFPDQVSFVVDVELWPINVAHHPGRLNICQTFERWLAENDISRKDKLNLDSLVMYRLEVTEEQANLLLEHGDVRLLDLPPRSGIQYHQLNVNLENLPLDIPAPPENAARICVLDSGIATNHPLIAPAMAESESFVKGEDEFDGAGHGTAVAGIALYGDIEACKASNYWKPELLIFNGKVLDENCEFDIGTIEKTLLDAVSYFVDEHGCRIFNLSIGNKNSPYDSRHIRGIAYVLDKLSREYDVLFVVSAGNFTGSVNPEVPKNSWREEYPEYLLCEQSVIFDPAPALHAITVGSIARHNATFDAQRYPEINQLAPASENQPSPFTCHGPSVKGAIKPELVAVGGNYASPVRTEAEYNAVARGMGVLTCNNKFVGDALLCEVSGTSYAAPYVTHLAGRLLNNYPKASSNLLRALIVNHANMPREIKDTFSEEAKEAYKRATGREAYRDTAGYGFVDESELFRSSETAVVLMAEEKIENNVHHFFELPLPEEFLRPQRATREIRVALAYSPAVKTTRIDYMATKIHYRLVKDSSLDNVQRFFNHNTQDENKSRGDDSVSNRDISADLRGRGSVQCSKWTIRQPNPAEKWFVVVTRQDKDWGEAISLEQEPYSLVVTVTDRENENAQLYTQISQRIEQQAQQRARAQGRARV